MLEINTQSPDFSLTDQNDSVVSLSDLSGQWVVLYFYPKDDTSGCTKEACDFSASVADFESLNAKVLGVSVDDAESHRAFISKYDLTISLLSDPDKIAHKAYEAWGLKKNYGKEYEGVIRSTYIISPQGVLVKSWKSVKVRVKRKSGEVKHADVVRETLEQLQASEKV
jgi:thioredoxin-dependent peroxiredoxin